jgi:2-hydroxychromene-2-carboxylate isomerase
VPQGRWVEFFFDFGSPTAYLAATQLPGITAAFTDAGWSAGSLAALVNNPAVKAGLIAATDEAVARGVFGAPSCFVGDELFFGQDRLDFVREALLAP